MLSAGCSAHPSPARDLQQVTGGVDRSSVSVNLVWTLGCMLCPAVAGLKWWCCLLPTRPGTAAVCSADCCVLNPLPGLKQRVISFLFLWGHLLCGLTEARLRTTACVGFSLKVILQLGGAGLGSLGLPLAKDVTDVYWRLSHWLVLHSWSPCSAAD